MQFFIDKMLYLSILDDENSTKQITRRFSIIVRRKSVFGHTYCYTHILLLQLFNLWFKKQELWFGRDPDSKKRNTNDQLLNIIISDIEKLAFYSKPVKQCFRERVGKIPIMPKLRHVSCQYLSATNNKYRSKILPAHPAQNLAPDAAWPTIGEHSIGDILLLEFSAKFRKYCKFC
uniref:Uncharacterized protein n=1 Tax=Romanomermis culicivorax TaxID=13658 RepID=A0A915IVY6_ROMCU